MHVLAERSVTIVQPHAWDDVVARFANATVFHSLAWLQVVSEAHNVKPLLLAIGDAEDPSSCEAAWPVLEMRKGPFRVLGSPLPGWSTAYMGPLFAQGADVDSAMSAFMQHSALRRHAYFACKVLDRDHPINLQRHGFSLVRKFDTYRIDLSQTEETLWGNLKSECRTRVRKAQKLGVEVRAETSGEFIEEFWRMSLETFAKANIQPTHSRRFAQELWKRLSDPSVDRVEALSAWLNGRRIATLVLPFDDHTMYYWGGAGYQDLRDIPAHNLLHWTAILQAKQRGLREYDFISTVGGAGRFKKTFGPEAVDIATHWERSPSKLMAAIKDKYERFLRKRQRIRN